MKSPVYGHYIVNCNLGEQKCVLLTGFIKSSLGKYKRNKIL